MKIVVTGGAGFIGSHVVQLLVRKGNEVLVLDDLSTGHMEWIQDLVKRKYSKVSFDLCDISDRGHVQCALMAFRPEVICHLAAQSAISVSLTDPTRTAMVNEIGTLNLIASAMEFGARRFIFASTSAVYQDTNHPLKENSPLKPSNPYGMSKMAAETYLREFIHQCVILRLGNVYGPRQFPIGTNQVVPLMLQHFLKGDDFTITGDGKQKRDFVYVGDVADAFLLGLYGKPGTYNIATGHPVSVNDLAGMLADIYGVHGYPWLHSKEQDARREVCMNFEAARDGLGWEPSCTLKDGLSMTAEWWNNRKV